MNCVCSSFYFGNNSVFFLHKVALKGSLSPHMLLDANYGKRATHLTKAQDFSSQLITLLGHISTPNAEFFGYYDSKQIFCKL